MRKWMRDRLKRPKKNEEAGKSQPAQAPLQPAYYDADVSAPAAATVISEPRIVEAEVETQPATEPSATEDAAEASPAQQTPPVGNADPRRRRRRGRGGRGRGGARGARTAAIAPASVAAEDAASVATLPSETAAADKATPAPAQISKGTVVLAIG